MRSNLAHIELLYRIAQMCFNLNWLKRSKFYSYTTGDENFKKKTLILLSVTLISIFDICMQSITIG